MSRERSRSRRGPRKDRLIQTRVAQELERALKNEADRRRLSVSHLIRNVLEDTFDLVDNVVASVDDIVADSVVLADQVRKDAENIAFGGRSRRSADKGDADGQGEGEPSKGDDADATPTAEQSASGPAQDDDPLADVDAWNAVTVNRPTHCAKCKTALGRGDRAHLGLTADPSAPRVWLCQTCLDSL